MTDLAQLKSTIDAAIEENHTVINLQNDVSLLKADVAILKTDVAILKTDVAALKVEHKKTNQRLDLLTDDFHKFGLRMESMQRDIKVILDAVIPAKQRAEQIDHVEAMVEGHEHRLCAVEISIKKHLHDHREV